MARSCLALDVYCGHVPCDLLLDKLHGATSIQTVGTSVVHEDSNEEVPYEHRQHTHFAWLWERAPNLHGAHLMDIELDGHILHPHAVYKKSLRWLQQVFTRHHHRHKTGCGGKSIFVPPVDGPWQTLPPCFECGAMQS